MQQNPSSEVTGRSEGYIHSLWKPKFIKVLTEALSLT